MIRLIATAAFGLEAVVKRELEALGMEDIRVEDGRIRFSGGERQIAKANLWLRSAERVLIEFGDFEALTYEDLFQGIQALPWEDLIPTDGAFPVAAKCRKSLLMSPSDVQAITKKAIVERLKKTYKLTWFDETGPSFPIEVAFLNNRASVTIDTSGQGLHKRGYRARAGDAPLKETLAAAMVQLSFWKPDRTLYDPFCGSGTILIEAALIARNIAPGTTRSFTAADWGAAFADHFKSERREALGAIRHDVEIDMLGSDIDKRSILRSRDNAALCGIDDIAFFMKDMRDVDLKDNYGVIITNPPYGQRLGERREAHFLIQDLGKKMQTLPTWSVYAISSDEKFEEAYGKKASRKRKLYNGRIKTDYYQFYGPKKPR